MNALSAIRPFVAPEVRPLPMPRAGADVTPMQPIPIRELESVLASTQTIAPPAAQGASFGNVIGELVHDVSAKQATAGNAVQGLISGQNVSLHQTMIAMEEASVSFQLMVEVRNKLLESYQELMRMQV